MLARLGIGEIIVIVTVAFLIFGPQKLPELGKSLGETIRNFKDSMDNREEVVSPDVEKASDDL